MKTCRVCKLVLSFEAFNKDKTRSDGYQTRCRECSKRQYTEYYINNDSERIRLRANNSKNRERSRKYVREVKSRPCADCGVQYPYYVMDLDHLGDKLFDLNTMVKQNHGFEKIKLEVDKCEVVCANCHRIRTWKRQNATR